MRRLVLGASILTCVLLLAVPADAARPRSWPSFRFGVGAEIPLDTLLENAPVAQVRLNFGKVFVIADFAYAITSLEEINNEDNDPGHDFTIAVKSGYYLIGTPETHLGVGGGFGVRGVGQVNQDVGAAISIMGGLFPEAFVTEGLAFTGFIGLAFEFYTEDVVDGQRSLFRFKMGSGTALVALGMMYYF